MSTTTRSAQPTPPRHHGWVGVCEEQVRALFDQVSTRVDDYVSRELLPLEVNLHRSFNPWRAAADLLHAFAHLDDRIAGRPTTWSPLPSTRRRQRRFAQAVLDADDLARFLNQTFDHLEAALARRGDPEHAAARVAEARELFAPLQDAITRRLKDGPRLVQLLSGPGAYTIIPGMWASWGFVAGERRREREEVYAELAARASFLLGELVYPEGRRPAPAPLKLAAAALMTGIGAAAAPTIAYSLVDLARLYWNHLDEIERLVLYGDFDVEALDALVEEDAPPEEKGDESPTRGLLMSWLEDVDLSEFDEDPSEDTPPKEREAEVRRPGLLMLVYALEHDRAWEDLAR